MVTIVVFTQNLVLESLKSFSQTIHSSRCVFVSTHRLFTEERDFLCGLFSDCVFLSFGEILSDKENQFCDENAYPNTYSVEEYYGEIKRTKNKLIIDKIIKEYPEYEGYLLCEDLGIYGSEWVKAGFQRKKLEYFYEFDKVSWTLKIKQSLKEYRIVRNIYNNARHLMKARKRPQIDCDVYSGIWHEKKYIFIGRLDRISYRMDIKWTLDENEKQRINQGHFYPRKEATYLTTLHESSNNIIPDKKEYEVYYIQDGYLPPNYSSYYLKFKPQNVKYYVWDTLGMRLFINQDIPAEIMPFRVPKYLPYMNIKKKIKTILVATSGPGDWTAQKNRSDEDLLVQAFCEIARRHPDIEIIYRCHPTWIHPEHNGINSINRIAKHFEERGLDNITLSTNIPNNDANNFRVSFPRQSLQNDLEKADIVFGEHSISMIDAAMKKIPFVSVNLTNRRNLFCGITRFGFPHCTCIDDIDRIILKYGTKEFADIYSSSIDQYNKMTDEEYNS